MSTSTPPRPRSLTDGLGLPGLRDIRLPSAITRLPLWLRASVLIAVLVLISLLLRTVEIGGTLWWAEASAIGVSTEAIGGVLHACYVGGAAPLYYLLLHFWTTTVGDTPGAARDLSLIFALLCIPAGAWAGWPLAGERGGVFGGVLFAFSSMLTEYGQQAQPYALLMLFGLLAATAFVHASVHRRRGYLPL